jgi:hypothetical protein
MAAEILESKVDEKLKADSSIIYAMFGLVDGTHGFLAAHLFEVYVLRRLQEGGRHIVESLVSGVRDREVQVAASPMVRFRSLKDATVTSAGTDVLLAPCVSNFGSIDALTKAGVLFQVTVRTEHPIKAAPVRSYCSSLGLRTPQDVVVVFIVPKGKRFAWDLPQHWVNAQGIKLVGSGLPPQFIMEM